MNDSVKTFIELGQRVDTINTLMETKRVDEAKSLKDWTSTELTLMKDDLVQYLRSITDTINVYAQMSGERHVISFMRMSKDNTVKDLIMEYFTVRYGEKPDISILDEIVDITSINRDNSMDIVDRSTKLVHNTGYSFVDRDRRITTFFDISGRSIVITTYIDGTSTVPEVIERIRDASYSHDLPSQHNNTYKLLVGDNDWTNQPGSFYLKWVKAGSPPIRVVAS